MTVNLQKKIRIGTRGSNLALWQAHTVRDALQSAVPDAAFEIVIIKTSGDWKPSDGEVRLKESEGGKGQFSKEIEQALLAGEIEMAVHSMKDIETIFPDGLVIKHMLPREDARDALIVQNRNVALASVADIPQKSVIGTASVRRQAFVLSQCSGVDVVPLRGNVETRIQKVRSGQVHFSFLAYAGLKRLGLEGEADLICSVEDMLPAAGQGAVGIEIRQDNVVCSSLLDQITCSDTFLRVTAERAVLGVLDGSCHTPIGAYALLDEVNMYLRAVVCALDGSQIYRDEIRGNVTCEGSAKLLGHELGQRLKAAVPPELLS